MFKYITPDQLDDPHVLPEGAEGPYIIDGQNRFVTINSYIIFFFSFVICREIIANREHRNLDLFRKFECEVFVFDHPESADQVSINIYIYNNCRRLLFAT